MRYIVSMIIAIIVLFATLALASIMDIDSTKLLAWVAFVKVVMIDLER